MHVVRHDRGGVEEIVDRMTVNAPSECNRSLLRLKDASVLRAERDEVCLSLALQMRQLDPPRVRVRSDHGDDRPSADRNVYATQRRAGEGTRAPLSPH